MSLAVVAAGLASRLGEALELDLGLGRVLALQRINNKLSGDLEKDLAQVKALASEARKRGPLEADLRPVLRKLVELSEALERRNCSEATHELAKGCESAALGSSKAHRTHKGHFKRLAKAQLERYAAQCLGEWGKLLAAASAGTGSDGSEREKVRRFGAMVYAENSRQFREATGIRAPLKTDTLYHHLTQPEIDDRRFARETYHLLLELAEQFGDPNWVRDLERSNRVAGNRPLVDGLDGLFRRNIVRPCRKYLTADRRAAAERTIFAYRYTYTKPIRVEPFFEALRDYRACKLLLDGQAEPLSEEIALYFEELRELSLWYSGSPW